jgi:hypothetical protein
MAVDMSNGSSRRVASGHQIQILPVLSALRLCLFFFLVFGAIRFFLGARGAPKKNKIESDVYLADGKWGR